MTAGPLEGAMPLSPTGHASYLFMTGASPPWFTVEAVSGAIVVRYSAEGLTARQCEGRVLIKADGAANSPQALLLDEVVD